MTRQRTGCRSVSPKRHKEARLMANLMASGTDDGAGGQLVKSLLALVQLQLGGLSNAAQFVLIIRQKVVHKKTN